MKDFEKLGVFYLGREYDLEKKSLQENLLLYDSKDLVTHAVCVGMTGSGKTGLCVGLLEEAAIDGIPAIVVDPKGDLSNLLLSFPDLTGSDFLPWVNEEEARKKGLEVNEYAEKQAALWKKGLGEWGQDGERIRRFRDSSEFTIYTPGSSAGIPVSILKSFTAPEREIIEDTDLFRERINTTVTSLLSLLGIDADPIQSREHILLSTILGASWQEGGGLDLAAFIQAIQSPPVTRIGVFDLESFFPSKERFALAMKLNNLLAAPGFSSWLTGDPLDIDSMLFTKEGKPKVSIFSISHLSDTERMFFVSLLLTQMLGWMRTQSGTTSLRALFYMDEIFGYFPPVANPPSKAPLLTLLKQARAFGLGIVLATQNPVDLDYKGLSNTGSWFIGRLQTERDKERVLDGLEGAGSSEGGRFDRKRMEQILSGLGKRVFLLNNVHEDEPVIFQTRWVLSYLRGPLTRNQIKRLMKGKKPLEKSPPPPSAASSHAPRQARVLKKSSRPMLPPGIPQYFLPIRSQNPGNCSLYYEPKGLASAKLYFADGKVGIASEREVSLMIDFPEFTSPIDWKGGEEIDLQDLELETRPEDDEGIFGELPKEGGKKKSYTLLGKDFIRWLYRSQSIDLLKSPTLKILSQPGETERDFRIRLTHSAHEKRDALITRMREKYQKKIERLEERIERAELSVEKEREQAKQQKYQTAISLGTTLLTAFLGRKRTSLSTIGRASTTLGRAGRAMKEGKDIDIAEEKVRELNARLGELQELITEEMEEIKASIDPKTEELETFVVKPKKRDIALSLSCLTWVPYWQDEKGSLTSAW